MEKKLSRLGKIGTLIPAIMMAGMMNCAAATFNKTPNSKSTSLGSQALVWQNDANKYNEKKAINTMTKVINSDLNQMKAYDRLEAKVQNEVVGYLAEMNANTLGLARLYKAAEDNTVANSGLTPNEINQIAHKKGVGTSDQVNVQVGRCEMQHFLHMVLDTQTLIRFRADEAEIAVMDEGDGHNEYLRFHTKGERDLRKESNAVLTAAKNDILAYTQYEYTVKGQKNGKEIIKKTETNLRNIETIVSKKDFNQNDYQTLLNLINETADLLPSTMFGTQAMRRGLVIEFASTYAMNHLLTNLTNLGYDINNYKAGAYAKGANKNTNKTNNLFEWNVAAIANATNKHAGVNLGIGATTQLANNWDLTIGAETNPSKGYNGANDSFQLLATGEFGKTTKNDNHFGLGAKAGFQFDKQGVSTPFGVNADYSWKINENFSLDFGVNSLANIQRSLLDIGTTIGATYRTKSWIIKFGVGVGYTYDWNKINGSENVPTNTPTTNTPKQPTYPGYGDDEVDRPGDTTDEGDIHNLPVKPDHSL